MKLTITPILTAFFLLSLMSAPICSESLAAPSSESLQQTLEDLERNMDHVETVQAHFVQEKKMKMFNHAIVLAGQFYMQKPGLFAWHTQSPMKDSVIIKNNKILSWNEDTDHTETISLEKIPVLKIAMEQVRIWFSGAYVSLLKDYKIEKISETPLILSFTPDENSWNYTVVKKVTLQFNAEQTLIETLHIIDKKGDESHFAFSEAVLNKGIDSSAWEIPSNEK